VRLVDRIAYVNHDIEDAIRAGVIQPDDLPGPEVALLGRTTSERLTGLVGDIVTQSRDAERIRQSREVGDAFLRLRKFMFTRVYLAPPASIESQRARGVVQHLFEWYMANPEELPESADPDLVRRVTDHVSGMTDRYALRDFRLRFMPREGPL
jgi:dGTPase